ncbi:hypothetical protein 65p353 [Aeromonas phage 65]|uniref:Uncharacterized protein n=1 Tax=Aeromonas phage 65 TaxID=2919549 RepID=E5DSI7_9CAUD|nr:hypothetical protein ST65p353 [Aeromonas phage 65]ADQ53361.1 hypothetical protein 65p353 [Aeromonas phage 65]
MEENEECYLPCIGVDGKHHTCLAWESVCLCGIKILHKNPDDKLFAQSISLVMNVRIQE